MKQKDLLINFYSLVGLIISLLLSYVIGSYDLKLLLIYISSTFLLVIVCVIFSLLLSKDKYEKNIYKLMDTMRGIFTMAEGRMIIDNKHLKYIEQDADEIWVLTKTLENDITQIDITEAVKKNLLNGKRYFYFIPNPETNLQIQNNKRKYVEKFSEFQDNFTFVSLPEDILFVFDEIVIFNPNRKNFFGYTYMDFEGTGKRDQVVRVSADNISRIIQTLSSKINPKKETINKQIKKIFEIHQEFNISKEYIAKIISMIICEEFSLIQIKSILDEINKKDNLLQKHSIKIEEKLKKIFLDLKKINFDM